MSNSPSRAEIVAFLHHTLQREANINQTLSEETDLLEELKLDSIVQLALVVAIENHFKICFDPDDERAISTVGSVVDLVQRRLVEEQATSGSEA